VLEEHQNIQHSAFGPATDRLALILAGAMQQRSIYHSVLWRTGDFNLARAMQIWLALCSSGADSSSLLVPWWKQALACAPRNDRAQKALV